MDSKTLLLNFCNNYCETFGVSIDDLVNELRSETPPSKKSSKPNIILEKYSDKSFAIKGDTMDIKDLLKTVKACSWNTTMKCWICSNNSKSDLLKVLKNANVEDCDNGVPSGTEIKPQPKTTTKVTSPAKSSTPVKSAAPTKSVAPTKSKAPAKSAVSKFTLITMNNKATKVMDAIKKKHAEHICDGSENGSFTCTDIDKIKELINNNMNKLNGLYVVTFENRFIHKDSGIIFEKRDNGLVAVGVLSEEEECQLDEESVEFCDKNGLSYDETQLGEEIVEEGEEEEELEE